MLGPAVGIVKLTTFAKLKMGNGKWQIKGLRRHYKMSSQTCWFFYKLNCSEAYPSFFTQ